MGKLISLLFVTTLLLGCTNDRNDRNNKKVQKEDNQFDGKTDTTSANNSKDKSYTWSKADQQKFLADCKEGHEGEDMTPEKINDLCACMLTEAQKYYSSYRRIDDSTNDDHDWQIVEKCKDHYPKEEE